MPAIVARAVQLMLIFRIIFSFCFLCASAGYANAIKIESWREMRDKNIVKQSLETSCGPSALATILTYHYNHPIDEATIIEKIPADFGIPNYQILKEVSESLTKTFR